MKKTPKLFLIMILGIAGICFAGAAIYGALHWHHVPGPRSLKLLAGLGVLAAWCFIGIKMLYDAWKN
jgi:hypothetical protein